MRILITCMLAGLAMTVIANESPVFRPGLWDYKRTADAGGAKPQTYKTRECVSPNEGMEEQNEMMRQAGCKVSPVIRSGNVYGFTIECVLQGIPMKSKSVITVENDSAYRIDVDALHDGKTTKEVLVARRVGDC